MKIKSISIFSRRGLAFRYSLFFLAGSFVIFFIAFYYTFDFALKILLEEAKKDASTLTDLTVSRITNILQPVEQVPLTLVHSLNTQSPRYDDILKLTGDIVLDNPVIFGSSLAFEPNTYRKDLYWYAPYCYESGSGLKTKVLGSTEYDYFRQDWYRIPKARNGPVWTEPYFDKGGGDTLMCTYSVPFYRSVEGKKTFGGVLTLDISLASFNRIVRSVKVYNSGYGFLISQKGRVIAHPESSLLNKDIVQMVRQNSGEKTSRAIGEMLRGKSGFVRVEALKMNNKPSWIYYAPVGTTGWSFAVIFEEQELLAGLIGFVKRLILIFVLSVLAILVITIVITRKFTRPIKRLVEATHRIGQGDFYAALPLNRSGDEVSQLTNAFALMQEELGNYIKNLHDTTVAKEKIESELNVAHSIQVGMLPREFPTSPEWDLHAILNPAKAVGGDLYDFFYQDDDHLVIAIADVAGKGVPASLFMMVARTLLRSGAISGKPVNEVMQEINTALVRENPQQMFVTFFTGILDIHTGVMEYCNAGHNPPFYSDMNREIRALPGKNGLPLGIFDQGGYTSRQYRFEPGDSLVLYTDGITEAINAEGGFYGEARLKEVIRRNAGLDAAATALAIGADVRDFASGTEQSDDITLLVLQYRGPCGIKRNDMQTIQLQLQNQLGELDRIVGALEEASARWDIPMKVVMELNLVLEELFTNIVFYAFEPGTVHQVFLTMELPEAGLIRITLRDDGKPFNLLEQKPGDEFIKPIEERKIGGLGIHFVRELMTSVEYQRTPTENIVILSKKF